MSLLQLPDPCLLAVLRCCDPHSMCSAARTHSRLHQAAVEALTNVEVGTGNLDTRQQRWHSLVDLHLPRHGQYVETISMCVEQA